jgi:hypothetical protein
MSLKTVSKSTTNKSIIKINKQDELDELDELTKLDNLLSEGSEFSTRVLDVDNTIKMKSIHKAQPIHKTQPTNKTPIAKVLSVDNNLLGENIDKTDVVDKRRARKLINSHLTTEHPQQKTFIKYEKSQQQLIDEVSDLYDNFESELMPKNYGNKWSDEDKQLLILLLKESTVKEIDYAGIALKLGRSEGGVKGEVKKMIVKRYLNGEEPDLIAIELNIQYKFIKILIKSYIDNEIEADIGNLEKENKFLKLKMENIELRKNMQKIIN